MSQHPSLKSTTKGKAHRSVWKRFERLKFLVEKEKWADSTSIFGLPKIKSLKLKIKKEKAAEAAPEAAGAGGVGVTPGTLPTQEGKGQAVSPKGSEAKPTTGKETGKEEPKGPKKVEKK